MRFAVDKDRFSGYTQHLWVQHVRHLTCSTVAHGVVGSCRSAKVLTLLDDNGVISE